MTSEENPPIEKPPIENPSGWSSDELPVASLADDLEGDVSRIPPQPKSASPTAGGPHAILADRIDSSVVEASIVESSDGPNASDGSVIDCSDPPPIPKHLQNISANGGSVGAIVLGVWSLLGSFMTSWSVINALLGLVLGFWGVTSRRPRLAWIGIVLCLISMFLSMIRISEFVGAWR